MNEKNVKPVDFLLLYELMVDAKKLDLEQIISLLSMNEVPMTYAVQKLGNYLGVLTEP